MNLLDKVANLAKRRGYVYPGSEIYGGLANTWDYGPMGAELLRNIRNLWWDFFVLKRDDIVGLDSSILMSPKVWDASGHTQSFTDSLIDCKSCKNRTRADHLIEDKLKDLKVEGKKLEELDDIICKNKIKCPVCGNFNWTKVRKFNLLFETNIGIVTKSQSLAYLRGETAQGMFVNFKNILTSTPVKIPFGIAQIGKAFRNEITKGHFIFRTLEFEQCEIEYFIREKNWEKHFDEWKKEIWNWCMTVGLDKKKLRWRSHTKDEISHYSKRTEDIEYDFPFGGYKELYGLAYRTDYDLKCHSKASGIDLSYTDPDTHEKYIPHVVEPTFGLNRTFLAVLLESYREDDRRVFLKLPPKLAPVKVAIFPLLANKDNLVKKAQEIYNNLRKEFKCAFDQRGNIGKRYYAQDEIGTPICITIDFQTLSDNTVTVRNRDTTVQIRKNITELIKYIKAQLEGVTYA
jgi:glycyl-tRNA synthetase